MVHVHAQIDAIQAPVSNRIRTYVLQDHVLAMCRCVAILPAGTYLLATPCAAGGKVLASWTWGLINQQSCTITQN